MNSFFSKDELFTLGIKSVGSNVLISRYAQLYNPEQLRIGNNVRIDDFCLLSGTINLGSYVHISSRLLLFSFSSHQSLHLGLAIQSESILS